MRYSPLLWASLTLLLTTACPRRSPEPEPEAVPLPAELKSYVMFQPGTYWIYQDSASRRLDSVWVVSTDTSVYRRYDNEHDYVEIKYEKFTMRTRSNLGGPDLIYGVERYCGLPYRGNGADAGAMNPCWVVMRGRSLPGSTTGGGGGVDVFPYALPRDLYRPNFYVFGTIIPLWHSQPITIGGRSYPDVMEVWVKSDRSEGGWSTHYYWAAGLGIVRQRVYEFSPTRYLTRTRTLVRSHIVQ